MERSVRELWVVLMALVLAIILFSQGSSWGPITIPDEAEPFQTALIQLGILYIIALFVERSLEVLIKVWREGEKGSREERVRLANEGARLEAEQHLSEYKAGTRRWALLGGLTLGIMVSLAGVRLLGPIFASELPNEQYQKALFHFTDVILTGGLIAGGSATIHQLMALVDDFLKASRNRTNQS